MSSVQNNNSGLSHSDVEEVELLLSKYKLLVGEVRVLKERMQELYFEVKKEEDKNHIAHALEKIINIPE